MKLEFVLPCAIAPIVPPISVGFEITVPVGPGMGAEEACVAIEEVEFERVGEEGRMLPGIGGGEGAMG